MEPVPVVSVPWQFAFYAWVSFFMSGLTLAGLFYFLCIIGSRFIAGFLKY